MAQAVNPGALLMAFQNLGNVNQGLVDREEQRRREREAKKAQRFALLGGIAGAGVGAFAGGPQGASLGFGIGSAVGRGAGGGNVSGAEVAQLGLQGAAFAQQQQQAEAERELISGLGPSPTDPGRGPVGTQSAEIARRQALIDASRGSPIPLQTLVRGAQAQAALRPQQADPTVLSEGQGAFDAQGNLLFERPKGAGDTRAGNFREVVFDTEKNEFRKKLFSKEGELVKDLGRAANQGVGANRRRKLEGEFLKVLDKIRANEAAAANGQPPPFQITAADRFVSDTFQRVGGVQAVIGQAVGRGRGAIPTTPVPGAQTPAANLPEGVTEANAISQAKQAIADGRDEEAVKKRLRDFGIDPSRLDE